LVREFLADIEHAYNSVALFETSLSDVERRRRGPFPFDPDIADLAFAIRFGRLRPLVRGYAWPLTTESIASTISPAARLILRRVRLESPGAWDFLGKLNPLEVLRQYLNDRHERRKDHEYRESAEKRKLLLENLKLENEVLRERIGIAKDLGASDDDLAPLLNELVYRPLQALDRHQDRNVITSSESLPENEDRKPRQG